MKFNHLKVPESWQHYWTRYPEGYTILEALINWVSQVDAMVDHQNKLNDNVKQFRNEIDAFVGRFDERLQTEVTQTLEDWQNSGFLDVVISEALQWQLDDYIATNEQDKLSINAQLQQLSETAIRPKTFGLKLDGTTVESVPFQNLLDSLDVVNNKYTVLLNKNDVLLINKTLRIPSNITLTGGGTIATDATSFTLDNLWNPAIVVNKNSVVNNSIDDTNIVLDDITILANFYVGSSVVRFSGITNFEIKNCRINIKTTPAIRHNAAIDVFSNAQNGSIHDNDVFIDSGASPLGCGGIILRNNKNGTPVRSATKNIQIYNNHINSDGHDELVYISSNGGEVSNIDVHHNTLIRRSGSMDGVGLTVSVEAPNSDAVTRDIRVNDNIITFEQRIAHQPPLRIGVLGEAFKAKNVEVRRNIISGELADNGIAILFGETVVVSDNVVTNTSENKAVYGIIGDWGEKGTICENNIVTNFNVGISHCWSVIGNKVYNCNTGIKAYERCLNNEVIDCVEYGIELVGAGWYTYPFVSGNYVKMLNGSAKACLFFDGTSLEITNAKIVNNTLRAPATGTSITMGIVCPVDTYANYASVVQNEIDVPSTPIAVRCYRKGNFTTRGMQLDVFYWGKPTFNSHLGQAVFNQSANKPIWLKTAGTSEKETLIISSGASVSGTISVTLNGVVVLISVTAGDSVANIDEKIRNTKFKDWVLGGPVGSGVITFKHTECVACSLPVFTDTDNTGVSASITTTTVGVENIWVDATGTQV